MKMRDLMTRFMTPRERLMTVMGHRQPDRVPSDLGGIVTGIAKKAYERLVARLGVSESTVILDPKQQLASPSEEVLEKLQIDTRYIFPGQRDGWKLEIVEDAYGYHYVDEWGIKLRMPRQTDSISIWRLILWRTLQSRISIIIRGRIPGTLD